MFKCRRYCAFKTLLRMPFQRTFATTRQNMSAPQIDLTPPEKLFRKCLLDCRNAMPDISGMKNLEIRWTGGWVRDKLLGTTSHDIDVALSTMTGEKFGMALQSYMKDNAQIYEDEAQKQGFKAEIKNLHKIAANPDKSKHLETITTRMFGIDVDFVNLRKEVYDDHSRNPRMEFGTPEEDALRRDACCNALFYNLDTQLVEDFTKKGLDDMKNQIIRTPLAPYQTFKDDPLRVLRLIRFAARLGYTVQDDALEAMADPRIHEALRLKISRERVGVEIGKIMTGPDPYDGLRMIYDRDLYMTVFSDPQSTPEVIDAVSFRVAINALQVILDNNSTICLVLKPKDDINMAWSLAAYVPYLENEELAVTAAREGIKATNNVIKVLGDAVRFRTRLRDLVQRAVSGDTTRATVGVMLKTAGKSWRYHVLYSLMCDCIEDDFAIVVKRYTAFARFVQEQNLEGAAELTPIINGNDIKKVLEVQRAGSWIKNALELVTEWQFANPHGTANDAKAMIKEKKNQIQGLAT